METSRQRKARLSRKYNYQPGERVRVPLSGATGTVRRHLPTNTGPNHAQLRVDWDNGANGLVRVDQVERVA